MKQWKFLILGWFAVLLAGCATVDKSVLMTPPAVKTGDVVFKTAMVENEDAFAAGKEAAEALAAKLGGTVPHAVLMVDCFDSLGSKKKALAGVTSVFGAEKIFGGAVYGMYTQDGASDVDTVSLLALAGNGLQVQAALTENMGSKGLTIENDEPALSAALGAGGAAVAQQLPNIGKSDLVILMGDAHSPKNQYLIDGLQTVAGKNVPVTGGSISKNDGLTFVYYRGKMYSDAAFALTLNGGLSIGQAGRQAKSNDEVISTANEGATTALKALGSVKPAALIAFDCAGRMGKLDNLSDEVTTIKTTMSPAVPIFGCYCAGEFGPADTTIEKSDSVSTGRGWHAMFSALGK